MINFPDGAVAGDEHVVGGVTWYFDGVKWGVGPSAASAYLPIAGGTMTGALVLDADPAAPLEASTKAYTDDQDALYLPLTGGTMTGALNGVAAAFSGVTYTGHLGAFAFHDNGLGAEIFSGPTNMGLIVRSDVSVFPDGSPVTNEVLFGGAGTMSAFFNGGSVTWVITFALNDDTVKTNKAAPNDALVRIDTIPVKEIDYQAMPDEDVRHSEFVILPDDIEAVLPEAKAGDTVNDKPLVAMLVAAMQQLSAKVTALEGGAPAREVTVNTVNVQPKARPKR